MKSMEWIEKLKMIKEIKKRKRKGPLVSSKLAYTFFPGISQDLYFDSKSEKVRKTYKNLVD